MRWRLRVGFTVLCLWASLEWLAGDLLPVGTGSMAGAGVRLLLVGLGAAVMALAFERGNVWRELGKVAAMGVALVAGPSLLLNLARGAASASVGVVAFALVPVGVMIVAGGMRLLPWGLAGVAGVLVLLPVTLPETTRGFVGVSLMAGAAGLTVGGLVGMRRLLQGIGLAGAVGAVGLGSGILLVLAGVMSGPLQWAWDAVWGEAVRALVVDLPELVLMIWLVREVSSEQVSARYLVAPLLTVVEGWFVVRAGIGLRMALGMGLLAGGAYGLLRREAGADETRLKLL